MLWLRTAEGSEHTLPVAGLVQDQAALPSNINPTAAHGYVGLQTLRACLREPQDFSNRLYVRFSDTRPGGRRSRRARPVSSARSRAAASALIPSPSRARASLRSGHDERSAAPSILTTMGLLTLLLAALLIINMMWAVISRQIPQIGVLKSLGALAGARSCGCTSGWSSSSACWPWCWPSLLAIGGGSAMTSGVAQTLNVTIRHVGLPPATVAVVVAAAFWVPVLAALVPVLSGARTTIREAIGVRPAAAAARRPPADSALRRRWRTLRAGDVPDAAAGVGAQHLPASRTARRSPLSR